MKREITPREGACLVVLNVLEKKQYVTVSLDNMIKDHSLSKQDRDFMTKIVYGTIKMKRALDAYIDAKAKIEKGSMHPMIRSILRISIYQWRYMDKVPNHAIVDEANKLTKKYKGSLSGFVNGVLRNIMRSNITLENMSIGIKESFPDWIIEKWNLQYGEVFTKELIVESNKDPKTALTYIKDFSDLDNVLKELKDEGFEFELSDNTSRSILLKKGSGILESETYKNKGLMIQDESSLIAASWLGATKDENILDMCAAPGGKTFVLASSSARVVARDIYDNKLNRLKLEAKRLGFSNIEIENKDALVVYSNDLLKYDRILVDAPCSGLGIIRRKPDIKWNRRIEDVKELVKMQKVILKNAYKYLKVGGTIIYSTCTLLEEENELQVQEFLKENKGARLIPYNKNESYLKLFPNVQGTDGFFAAKIVKEK